MVLLRLWEAIYTLCTSCMRNHVLHRKWNDSMSCRDENICMACNWNISCLKAWVGPKISWNVVVDLVYIYVYIRKILVCNKWSRLMNSDQVDDGDTEWVMLSSVTVVLAPSRYHGTKLYNDLVHLGLGAVGAFYAIWPGNGSVYSTASGTV